MLVASGDRDAYQLASGKTTILQPIKAGEMARIGPAEVRERYGVDPARFLTSSRSGAMRRTRYRVPRAWGPRQPPACSLNTGRWRTCSPPAAFGQAGALRLYRSIATMDRSAPLPSLRSQKPTWDKASALARAWQLNRLADRLADLAR